MRTAKAAEKARAQRSRRSSIPGFLTSTTRPYRLRIANSAATASKTNEVVTASAPRESELLVAAIE